MVNFLHYALSILLVTIFIGFNMIPLNAEIKACLLPTDAKIINLLNLPPDWIKTVADTDEKHPPIKLTKPTNVIVPDLNRVKFHFNSATKSYCYCTKELYIDCVSTNCRDFKMLKVFDNDYHGTLVVVGYYPNSMELVISHRGSMTIQNWLMDVSYGFIPMKGFDPKIQVHSGFYVAYNSYAKDLNDYLLKLLNDGKFKGYKVIITGQSLGAAIASLHTAEQTKNIQATGHDVELFTYHSPRVGNREFVDYVIDLNIPMARYTNRGDLVSHVPFRRSGYVHLPGEVRLPQSEIGVKVKLCDQEWDEDPECGWKSRHSLILSDHLFGYNQLVIGRC